MFWNYAFYVKKLLQLWIHTLRCILQVISPWKYWAVLFLNF
jgi:hypothetical protein